MKKFGQFCPLAQAAQLLCEHRVVVQFEYADASKGAQEWWLVSDNGEIELCLNEPGGDVDIVIRSPLKTMTAVWTCQLDFDDAVQNGEIEVFGDSALTEGLADWLQASALSQLGSTGVVPNLDWQVA